MNWLNQLDTHVVLMTVTSVIRVVVVRVLDLAALALVLRGSLPGQRADLLQAFTSYARGRSSSVSVPPRLNRFRRRH
jgi:hypothetical protein